MNMQTTHIKEGNCMLLTIDALRMLVPRTIVAEVLGATLLEFARDENNGLDFFEWRGRRVPLLGAVIGATRAVEITEESKVAIFHGLKNQQLLPYYGFVISRSPRLLRVSDGDLEEVTAAQLHPAELMRIRVEGNEACIPKVDHFEHILIDLMKAK